MPQAFRNMIDWFLPETGATDRNANELARIFIFTHLFGPVIAQPMNVYLYFITRANHYPLFVMSISICSFWVLPFLLRSTGNMTLVALMSFQILTAGSLFGAYHYGGFSSPFLPWLTVALLLGLFYLSKKQALVLAIFVGNIALFLAAIGVWGIPTDLAVEEIGVLGWLSVSAAAVYMSWMAVYYSKIMALRDELNVEAENYRATTEQLEQAQRVAEETRRGRDTFFAKMSHELRTPLNAIIGYSEILLEEAEFSPSANGDRSADISRINSAGKHLLSLVSEVLDSDGFENDLLRTNIAKFTIGDLCEEVVATARSMVEANGNRFTVICPQRDMTVTSDQTKLRQMMLNLLSNAGKFTRSGAIRLEIKIVENDDRRLEIVVSDTGIGIAPEALPRLFTDYEQADASISGAYGGTGLGLALTRKQAILLGGEIRITSKPGHGSTFTIDLPAVFTTDRQEDGADVQKPVGHRLPARQRDDRVAA